MPTLHGMTWDHPRGYDPLVACSAAWETRTGVRIEWERRSLQDFESFPVAELAQRYDLIVIDHPHVGQITRERCLVPLDDGPEIARLGKDYVGASLASYVWEGRLWALPIDAAAQVQAWRPDRLARPPAQWRQMLELAAAGEVLCPLRPPHDLMALFTLSGLSGSPARVDGPELLAPAAAGIAYELLRELTALLDPACLAMDPIAVLERLSQPASTWTCSPLIYGYVSYCRSSAARAAIAFGDLAPLMSGARPTGSALGGTGIAVSSRSPHQQAAIEFAWWLAGREAQRGPYLAGGGQPASAAAWEDAAANSGALDFYRNTRATLESAWLRPRQAGYMRFQQAAAERLRQALASGEPARSVIAAINRLFDGVQA
ncbi:MAG TPA: ABC transporter substrate-binding protein [Steroidobacteraceae bacterium]|nr:ABC transporter substrate-binding protein [Steroidobacteraceae bacterium]